MTELFTKIDEHYERHQSVYKYLVFPIMWLLGAYAACAAFYLFVLQMLLVLQ